MNTIKDNVMTYKCPCIQLAGGGASGIVASLAHDNDPAVCDAPRAPFKPNWWSAIAMNDHTSNKCDDDHPTRIGSFNHAADDTPICAQQQVSSRDHHLPRLTPISATNSTTTPRKKTGTKRGQWHSFAILLRFFSHTKIVKALIKAGKYQCEWYHNASWIQNITKKLYSLQWQSLSTTKVNRDSGGDGGSSSDSNNKKRKSR